MEKDRVFHAAVNRVEAAGRGDREKKAQKNRLNIIQPGQSESI
jgi:hypothetical protein